MAWGLGAALLLAGIGDLWRRGRRRRDAAPAEAHRGGGMVDNERPQQVADRDDPERAFAQCCVFVITGGHDYGYFPAHAPAKMLADAWDVTDAATARRALSELTADPHPGDDRGLVFDRLRALHVARASAGAGYVPPDESWAWCARINAELRQRLPSFEAIAAQWQAASTEWRAERGLPADVDTPANIAALRRTLWTRTHYHRGLASHAVG